MKFDLGEVLTRTWKIGWNHKVLWLWQLLPGIFGALVLPISLVVNPAFMMMLGKDPEPYMNSPWMPLAFLGVGLLFGIPSAFLGVLVQLTTTYGAMKVERGADKLAFMELFHESKPYYWRVFGLYFIFFIAWMVVIIGFQLIFFAGFMLTAGLGAFCFMPFFLLLIPVVMIGFSVLELAQSAIVVDDMSTTSALSRGWELFRTNWLGVIILLVVIYFAMYILSMVASLPMMFLTMMIMPMTGFESQSAPSTTMVILLIAFISVAFVVVFAVQGILMTFFQTAWTVLYRRINGAGNVSVRAEALPE
jgi:hypothetical protein